MNTPPKRYIETSYYKIMIASILAGFLFFPLMWLLPHLPVSEAQRGQVLQLFVQGWLWIVGATASGNVAARGLVSVVKTLLQRESGDKNAAPIELPAVIAALWPLVQMANSTVPATVPATVPVALAPATNVLDETPMDAPEAPAEAPTLAPIQAPAPSFGDDLGDAAKSLIAAEVARQLAKGGAL